MKLTRCAMAVWYVYPTVRRAFNYGVLGNNYAPSAASRARRSTRPSTTAMA